jgi:chromate transporter
MSASGQPPAFRAALRFWIRLGFISFGGPAGQIAILHRETVERRGWIPEDVFTRGLAFCTSLPGPEAQQLATWIGWRLHGIRGAIAAAAGFVVPSFVLLLGLSWGRAAWGEIPSVGAFLFGLRVAVAAVILDAVFGMARKRLVGTFDRGVAFAAFVATVGGAPFPVIVAAAAGTGLLLVGRDGEGGIAVAGGGTGAGSARRFLSVLATGVALWLVPWAFVAQAGAPGILKDVYVFFTQASFVTFGGAYAVLSYVLDAATGERGWLSRAEALDGIALAETTPGPLIIVLQYVGFFAGWHASGTWSPAVAGAAAGALTSWATFLPSTGLVILLAPHVEAITSAPRLRGAFRAVGGAVVGVVFAFALDYLRGVARPAGDLDATALLLSAVAFAALRSGRIGMMGVIGAGVAVGLARAAVETWR